MAAAATPGSVLHNETELLFTRTDGHRSRGGGAHLNDESLRPVQLVAPNGSVMLGSRVKNLVDARVLDDSRSLFGRRPEETNGSAAGDREAEAVLVIHGPSTHPDLVRDRKLLTGLAAFLYAVDIFLVGFAYWLQPPSAAVTAELIVGVVLGVLGLLALRKQSLVGLGIVQIGYAIQFVVGLMMVTMVVELARLVVIIVLYFAVDALIDRSSHQWFVPFY